MSDSVAMLPCPFCEGPPSLIVQNGFYPYGEAPRQAEYGDEGLWVKAFVFCHECGAEGPSHEMSVYLDKCYAEAETFAVSYWNTRNARHRDLFDDSEARGLAFYPRKPQLAKEQTP